MFSKFNGEKLYCRNRKCPNYGKKGNGNIILKEFKGRNKRALLMCKICKKCFSETHGTPFFGLKTSISEVAEALALIPNLGSIRAVARFTNHKPDTIRSWIDLAEEDSVDEINYYFYKNLHLTQVQIDEIWTSINKRKRGNPNNGKQNK